MAIQRILVPVDYSSCSRAALTLAVEFAQRFNATLDVVHVWDRPSYVTDVVMRHSEPLSTHSVIARIQENAERDLSEFLAGATLPAGVTLAGRLLSGDPTSAILEDLKATPPDLVIVGTHGRTGLTHVLLGSVAEKLVRLAPMPVLTVPDDAVRAGRQ